MLIAHACAPPCAACCHSRSPIFVTNIKNFLTFGQEISNLIGQPNFRCFSRVKDIKINTNTRQHYKTLVKHLTDKKYEFHCYQLKEEKSYRVVLRGLHNTTPTDAIKRDIEELGHKVRQIACVLHPTEKYPLPLFFVDLEPAPNNAEIFNIMRLVYSCVRFEEPRQKAIIVQCTRCQNLGHTKAYCHHQARCVKCAGPHLSESCQKTRETPAKCALCGDDHPANYRGCLVYKNFQRQRAYNSASKTQDQKNFASRPEKPDSATRHPEKNENTGSQPSASIPVNPPRQGLRTTYSYKLRQPRGQAPQTSHPVTQPSQPLPCTSQPQTQAPQDIPLYKLPLKVKLPPEASHPAPAYPIQIKPPTQAPLKVEPTPHITRCIQPPPSQVNPIPQASDFYPFPAQKSTDITAILSSFLLDLKETIKPLISLLTRILSEIPFNLPR
ncbi:hypothetical protein [Pantoea sp. Taur]|uniref:hypothetical protein n=1 Tax=Pantoea sp. Taur TaxID=2576757 RepID=UPI00358DE014